MSTQRDESAIERAVRALPVPAQEFLREHPHFRKDHLGLIGGELLLTTEATQAFIAWSERNGFTSPHRAESVARVVAEEACRVLRGGE
jgi:hypothetical protein